MNANADPRGTVIRCFTNGNGEVVSLIKWMRGTGPAQVIGQFRDGQAVKIVAGEVVGA